MTAPRQIKTEIINQLQKWKKEHWLFLDVFSHTAGKNKEIAQIGDKVIDLILYKILFSVVENTTIDNGLGIKYPVGNRCFNYGRKKK